MLTPSAPGRRSFWLRHLHRWHWISSGLCLVGMLLFAITGFTLNHAAEIEATPVVTSRDGMLPEQLRLLLAQPPASPTPLPSEVRRWLARELGIVVGEVPPEWSEDEIYQALPRPGGDGWVAIDRASGSVAYEGTDRGWVAYLNDLHKGRHAGLAWSLFLDAFALACLVFCVTGLFLLQLHARGRPATWPVVGLGVVLPALLAILLIH